MNSISNKNYAWMSQSAYLDLRPVLQGASSFLSKLTVPDGFSDANRLSIAQASQFARVPDGVSLIAHQPNTANGTSLTIFKSNEATNSSYTIAVRGTEPTGQLLADLRQDLFGVVLAGKAKVQLIEAFRYYKRATTPGGSLVTYSDQEKAAMARVLMSGTIWAPASAVETIGAAISIFNALSANDLGLGPGGQTLIPAGATVNFTGHSLGGHVAYLLAQLVHSTASGGRSVGDVMTYNAPGENALLYEVQNWLGISTSSATGTIGSKHQAFYGEGGLNVTAGLGQVIGTRRPIFIEREADGYGADAGALPNHSIVKLSDSLALYDLFALLDANVTDKSVNNLLSASANKGLNSLEAGLDAIRKIVLGSGVAPTKLLSAADDRERYYANLFDFREAIQQRGLAGQFTVRDLQSSSLMLEKARGSGPETLAYRYALKELNPFVLVGPASVYAAHNVNGELDLYNATTGSGSLTETWLADRASFLSWKNQKNIKDVDDDGFIQRTDFGAESFLFTDRTLKNSTGQDYSVRVLGGNNIQRTDPIQILFGSDSNDVWTGSHYGDHLYGEGGDDLLSGGSGNDYLEGGKGNDRLSGDDGNDILIGAAGNDTLLAGSGSNRLEGGAGFDSYEIESGGLQVITDLDGAGEIKLDGVVLTGGARTGANRFSSEDGSIQYTVVGDLGASAVLQISGGLTVENFHNGDLGIILDGTVDPETPRLPGHFTRSDDDDPESIDDVIWNTGIFIPDSDPLTYVADYIDVYTGSGNDLVVVDGNHVSVDAGDDNDLITAQSPSLFVGTTLIGGDGIDVIGGSGGDDRMFGGVETEIETAIAEGDSASGTDQLGDWLSGWGGDDTIVGSDGADVLFGGGGNNKLVGGAGDDHIYGDEDASPSFAYDVHGNVHVPDSFNFQWTFQNNAPGDDRFQELPASLSQLVVASVAGSNTIYAGNGNDWVSGGDGDDYISGGAGHDILNGDGGINVIDGGEGDDRITSGLTLVRSGGYLDGGAGDDQIIAANGHYVIDGGTGNDRIEAYAFDQESGSFFIYTDEGDDFVMGSYADDYVELGDGTDAFIGTGGKDYVRGGNGDDYLQSAAGASSLYGEDGNDVLVAGPGSDGSVLDGGAGDDEYQFLPDAGLVTVEDTQGSNRIVFLAGEIIDEDLVYAPSNIYLEWTGHELAIVSGEGVIRVTLADDTVMPTIYYRAVSDYADGRWVGIDTLISTPALTIQQAGSDGDDFLEAHGSYGNVMSGLAGNDFLAGASGSDTLSGGTGDDSLDGGAGNDTYRFQLGDGRDLIAEVDQSSADVNTLRFGPDISAATVSVAQGQDNLILTIGDPASGDSVSIVGGASRDVIARVEFNDGMVWNATMLRSLAVLIPDPVPEFESFPPPDDSESPAPTIGGGGGGEADAPTPSADAGALIAGGDQTPGSDFSIPLPSFLFSVESNDVLAGASVEFSGGGLPQFNVAEISAPSSFNSLAPPTIALPPPELASGPSGPNASRSSAASVGASVSASPDANGPSVARVRDGMSSLVSSSPDSPGDAMGSQDEPALESRAVQRETQAGGLVWLAQQSEAPRESAPALTQWAIANALLQFRIAGIDESPAANSSAGFINSPIAGLPGLSELAPLGMGTSGVGSEGARLQSFSGLSEGLTALAA